MTSHKDKDIREITCYVFGSGSFFNLPHFTFKQINIQKVQTVTKNVLFIYLFLYNYFFYLSNIICKENGSMKDMQAYFFQFSL